MNELIVIAGIVLIAIAIIGGFTGQFGIPQLSKRQRFVLGIFGIGVLIIGVWPYPNLIPPPVNNHELEIDLIEEAPEARWHNNDRDYIPFGTDSSEGAITYLWKVKLEDGSVPGKVLYTHPKWVSYGFMHGEFV